MDTRLIKKSEWDKLRVFNAAAYRPGHILTDKAYYDWQFADPFHREADAYATVGLFDKRGDIIGTFGRFPLPYDARGRTVEGNCLANLMIKRDLRAMGLGYMLLEAASRFGDVVIDHTINEEAWPLFMKAGWRGENLKRYLFIIRAKTALYDLPVSGETSPGLSNVVVEDVTVFDDQISSFWDRIRHRYPITPRRDASYLNWRYAKNPFVTYHMWVVKQGGEMKALVIVRVEEVKREGDLLGVRAGRIIDLVADEEGEKAAFTAAISRCRLMGVDFIDYFSSGNFHRDAARDAGFVDGDIAPYDSLPILFNPVSGKRRHLNFAVRRNPHTELSDWYTTKGGGDQDRPY